MNRTTILTVVGLVLVAVASVVSFYAYRNNTTQPPVVEKDSFVDHLSQDWPTVREQLPFKAGEAGKWILSNVKTISSSSAIVAFDDGLNGHMAIMSYNSGHYKIEKTYEAVTSFTSAEFTAIQKQYGDASFTPGNYEASEGDGHLFPVETNLFVKAVVANPTSTPIDPNMMTVQVALLNPDGSLPNQVKPGDISGCDSVVLVPKQIARTPIVLFDTLRRLLADRVVWQNNNTLYNYLAQGNLKLNSVAIKDGLATISLTGTPPPLSGVCDDPRLLIQITQTARQFPTVSKVKLYVNGVENTGSGNEKGE